MPRLGYKQTAKHIRNSKHVKKSVARKKTPQKTTPGYQVVVDPFLVNMANADTLPAPKMDFDAARAYLTRLDTAPDTDLTPEERFIKRMGQEK